MKLLRNWWLLVLFVTLFHWSRSVSAQDAKLGKITISYPAISASQAVLWIAKETGMFRKSGLDVDLIYVSGGPRAMAGLLSGQLQIIGTGGNALVAANLQGARDAVLIATTYNTLIFYLMTQAELKEPKDLKGKTLGVSGHGSLTDFTARYLLKRWGLKVDQDVAIRALGGLPEVLAAMKSGVVDGGVLSPPGNLQAQALGFREFADAGSAGLEYAQTGYATMKPFIRQRRDTVAAFVRALTEAIHYFKTNKQSSLNIIQQYTRVQDPKILEETYRVYALRYLPKAPYATANGVKTILESLIENQPGVKTAKPEEFIDASFVQELDKMGWIERIYR